MRKSLIQQLQQELEMIYSANSNLKTVISIIIPFNESFGSIIIIGCCTSNSKNRPSPLVGVKEVCCL
jgi:hypothetical protein